MGIEIFLQGLMCKTYSYYQSILFYKTPISPTSHPTYILRFNTPYQHQSLNLHTPYHHPYLKNFKPTNHITKQYKQIPRQTPTHQPSHLLPQTHTTEHTLTKKPSHLFPKYTHLISSPPPLTTPTTTKTPPQRKQHHNRTTPLPNTHHHRSSPPPKRTPPQNPHHRDQPPPTSPRHKIGCQVLRFFSQFFFFIFFLDL